MRILHINTTDQKGGAARAAYRVHRALVDAGADSRMRVINKTSDDPMVIGGMARPLSRQLWDKLHRRWTNGQRRGWHTDNVSRHTFGETSAGLLEELNASDADILNLHWVSDMLSVVDIGRLRKPLVWTLHDMWAFCGGEHYAPSDADARFRVGYTAHNRPEHEAGPDLNRRTWQAKTKAWKNQRLTVVTPSRWLADCARQSVLFGDKPVHVIANPLSTEQLWRPIPQQAARTALDLPSNQKLILTGADSGMRDPRKGGDLIRAAIERLARDGNDVELVVFGKTDPMERHQWPRKVHWLDAVRDDRVLALAYSAADVMVVPSRQEAFGQTASEAQACGTPVVAFDIGGLPDIVAHRKTGWLAKPFDANDLAEGIQWVLEDIKRWKILSRTSRNNAVSKLSEEHIAGEYLKLYQNIMCGVN